MIVKKQVIFFLILLLSLSSCGVKGGKTPAESESIVTRKTEAFSQVTSQKNEVSEEISENEACYSADEEVEKLLSKMTLREKVGQLFLVRNPRTEAEGIELIEKKGIGGIIFFGRDFKNSTPEKFRALISSYGKSAEIPLLTAVDEEGGDVCRVSNYKAFRDEKFPSPAELYAEGGMQRVLSDCDEKSSVLLSLGLNFNLAPVADVSEDGNDFIFHRAFGGDRDVTAEYASSLVKRMNKNGILSALKHFPGYGNNKDTHTGISYDGRSIEYLRENDLVPFIAAIKEGAPIVMISHNVILDLDGEHPASLSPKIYELLRNEIGFGGVILTDDLSMGAIEEFTESGEAAVIAIEAGADLLCCSDIEVQYSALLKAVENGRITIERIEESVMRLLSMKLKYGIIES